MDGDSPLPVTIRPGEHKQIVLKFTPATDAASFSGELGILSNDPDTPHFRVDLSAGNRFMTPINDGFFDERTIFEYSGDSVTTGGRTDLKWSSKWFFWKPRFDGFYNIRISSSNFDPTGKLYYAASYPPVSSGKGRVAVFTDRGNYEGLSKYLRGGIIYAIEIGGYNEMRGIYDISFERQTLVFGPVNDNFASRASLSSDPAYAEVNTVRASLENFEPRHSADRGGGSVWWEWTAPSTGWYRIDTSGYLDSLLSVYTGTELSNLVLLAENDDEELGTILSAVTFQAVAGAKYQIRVDGYMGAAELTSLYIRSDSGPMEISSSPGGVLDSQASISLGTAALGSQGMPVTFTVTNTGSAPLVAVDVEAIDVGGGAAEVIVDGINQDVLFPGDSGSFSLKFAPNSAGPMEARIIVSANEGVHSTAFNVTGTASGDAPEIALSYTNQALQTGDELALEDRTSGDSSVVLFTVLNKGTAPLEIEDVFFTGDDAASFGIVGSPEQTIGPNNSVVINLLVNPTRQGKLTAVMNIQSNDADESIFSVELAPFSFVPSIGIEDANGEPIPNDSQPMDMGVSRPGTPTAHKEFLVRNTGSGTLTITDLHFAGPNPNDFLLASEPEDLTLESGEATSIRVVFRPLRYGGRTGNLVIESSDPAHPSLVVPLTGTGQESISFSSSQEISIPSVGAAAPYPSTISVSGVQNEVLDLRVNLYGLTHSYPDDIDIFLIAPSGKIVGLMSDSGGNSGISNTDIVFKGSASSPIPDLGPITVGEYAPSNYEAGDQMPPGESGNVITSLNDFLADNLNGTWKLYISDDTVGDSGSLQSWTLEFSSEGQLSELEKWRLDNFGILQNIGIAADDMSAAGDGISNFFKFAIGLNPFTRTASPVTISVTPLELKLVYVRNKGAIDDGVSFKAEWSETLSTADWSAVGISTSVQDQGDTELVTSTIPRGSSPSKYLKLRIDPPDD
jgi:subtilisin-like proprotein convertase family protein